MILNPNNDETRSSANLTSASNQRMVGLAGTSEKQQQVGEYFGAGDFKVLSLADFRFVFNLHQMRAIELLFERAARRAKKRVPRREVMSHRGSKSICESPSEVRYVTQDGRLIYPSVGKNNV